MSLMPFRALFKNSGPVPATITVVFEQVDYQVQLVRNPRARRYTLRIHSVTRAVLLTIPPRGNLRDAKTFAEKHGSWIAARVSRLPPPVPLCDGTVMPLRGVPHRIVHKRGMRGTVWAEVNGDGERLLCVAGGDAHISRRIRDFLKREARKDLAAASARAAAALGVGVARIAIRDQVSRWGSCSAAGVLSYSWRLILAPPFVLEYLAAHEAAHLVEMNHSRRFWRLVESINPDCKRAKDWLDTHGSDLHRYGLQGEAADEAAASRSGERS